MARRVRVEFPGAVYHVMSRGNRRQIIFRDNRDRMRFLETLAEGCDKTGWLVHAYVLMGNHFHLLLETPEANLVAGMKWMNGTYTQRFNARHQLIGHLFQGRYKALLVDDSANDYFQIVSTYIHLNPARAGLIRIGEQPLREYSWSSYPCYLKRRSQRPQWLCVDRVLGSLGLPADAVRERKDYEVYMEGRALELNTERSRQALEEEWRDLRRGWFLGEPDFRERLETLLEKALRGKDHASFSGGAKHFHDEAAAEELLKRSLEVLRLTEADLRAGSKGALEKQLLAWFLRKRTVVTRAWISRRLRMGDESRVTKGVTATRRSTDVKVSWLKKRLEALVS